MPREEGEAGAGDVPDEREAGEGGCRIDLCGGGLVGGFLMVGWLGLGVGEEVGEGAGWDKGMGGYFVGVFGVHVCHQYQGIERPTPECGGYDGNDPMYRRERSPCEPEERDGEDLRRVRLVAYTYQGLNDCLPTAATFPNCTLASGTFFPPIPAILR